MALPFPVTLTSEFLYGFLMKQLSALVTTQFQRTCTTYLSSAPPSKPTTPVDDERELELLQMDRLLKWMALVFDGVTPVPSESKEAQRAYKQELFSIYRTLCSDYQQYRRWKQYNQSIWFLSSYRTQDTKALARKILSDVRLFKEGLQLWVVMGAPKGTKESFH
jgi:hypothetical protein